MRCVSLPSCSLYYSRKIQSTGTESANLTVSLKFDLLNVYGNFPNLKLIFHKEKEKMKTLLALIIVMAGVAAQADVYVPYGQWTALPHCGGQTRLTCDDVNNARANNQCRIEFSNSYGCNTIKMYV